MINRHDGPRTTDHGPRAAFTLIELLVVMSIMATLMALTAAAVSHVIANNRVSTTTEIIRKLGTITEQAVRQVNDSAREERIPRNIPGDPFFSAPLNPTGNPDLARQLYIDARMAQEFPMTYDEARSPGYLLGDPSYQSIVGSTSTTGDPTERSVCLHMALATKNRRGDMTSSQFIAEYTKTDTAGKKIIYDAWDEPIMFQRRSITNKPVIVVISAGPNRKFGNNNWTSPDNDAQDNIYSVLVGR